MMEVKAGLFFVVGLKSDFSLHFNTMLNMQGD